MMNRLEADLLEGIKKENQAEAQAMQQAMAELLDQLQSKAPDLMSAQNLELKKHTVRISLDDNPNNSLSWTTYYRELKNHFLLSIKTSIEDSLGYQIDEAQLNEFLQIDRDQKNNQLSGIFHVVDSMIDQIRDSFDEFKGDSVINMRNAQIRALDNIRTAREERVSPHIDISITFPTCNTVNLLRYHKEGEVLKEDCIYSFPSVTLDTDVFINMKRGRPLSPVKLRKKCMVDLAVTRRIEQDLKFDSDDEQFLQDNNIRKITSIMRTGFDTKRNQPLFDPQFNKMGSTEFFNITRCVIDSLIKTGQSPPGYLDWDHLHSHYVSKRDIFLTQDKELLGAGRELKQFGIHVMTIEQFLTLVEQNGQLICIKNGDDTKPRRVWVKIKGTENSEDLKNFDDVIPYRQEQ